MPPAATPITGLSQAEAALRLQQYGPNELPSEKKRTSFTVARDILREPMFLLLIGTCVIYLLVGEIHEALGLIVGIFVIIAITFHQQKKTENALAALRTLSSPKVQVVREGQLQSLPARDLAPGDVALVAEGTRVPADGFLLSATNLEIDESLLTGESLPVHKLVWDGAAPMALPGGDGLPSVYSGTLVVQGRGTLLVSETGSRTQLGLIGQALKSVHESETALQKQTRRLTLILAVLGLLLCAAVTVIYALTRGNWVGGLLAGLTLAISMVPEEFAVVLTVFFAIGAWRIAQTNVLTRHTAAIEALGAANILCVDKTGTITMNRMSVVQVYAPEAAHAGEGSQAAHAAQENSQSAIAAFTPAQLRVIEVATLASQERPVDPTDRAFVEHGSQAPGLELHKGWQRLREYPVTRDLLATTHVWSEPGGTSRFAAAKGAPEAIARLCRLDSGSEKAMLAVVQEMAGEGLRVLGIAEASVGPAIPLPDSPLDFNFRFVGLAGLADPVRPGVPESVRECSQAGIRVVMITGDYPLTAQRIGREIGLESASVLSGSEITQLSDDELASRVQSVSIFARVLPEQKLRLVRAFQHGNSVVAMTGDGVNDAPALKAADIGIAMGGRGTDVAREAADLVLVDDDFTSIVKAIRMGRRIFDNLKKATRYIFALHVPIAGMSFFPVLLNWPLALLPMHVVFLELVTDPACSIAFEAEPEESDVMNRPPRNRAETLLTRGGALLSLLEGGSILAVALTVYALSLRAGYGGPYSRALAFTALIVANVALMLSSRSSTGTLLQIARTPNPSLRWIILLTIVSLSSVLFVPFLREVFQFAPVPLSRLALAVLAGAASLAWLELWKIFRRVKT